MIVNAHSTSVVVVVYADMNRMDVVDEHRRDQKGPIEELLDASISSSAWLTPSLLQGPEIDVWTSTTSSGRSGHGVAAGVVGRRKAIASRYCRHKDILGDPTRRVADRTTKPFDDELVEDTTEA